MMTTEQSIAAAAVHAWTQQLERADAACLKGADRAVETLPTAAELKRLWDEVHARLVPAIAAFTASDWGRARLQVGSQGSDCWLSSFS